MILTSRALMIVYPCKLVFPDGTGFDYPNGFQYMVLEDPDGKEYMLPSGLELELDDEIPLPVITSRIWVSPVAYKPKLIPTKRRVPDANQGTDPKDVSSSHPDGSRTVGKVERGAHRSKKSKG